MNNERNRLRTFLSGSWPANAAVDCHRIAKAGFYYTGVGTEVQCFLCSARISQWDYGDQVMSRHRQIAPDCPFVLNPSATCNVPLVQPLASVLGEVEDEEQASLSEQHENAQGAAPSNPIQECMLPYGGVPNPLATYGTYQQRLSSYTHWPNSAAVSPESLAMAGFYYLQIEDMVECVHCHGIVKKWEPGDDPYSEHRKHFPSCDFYLRIEEARPGLQQEKVELENVKLMPGTTASDLGQLGIQSHLASRQPKHATYEGRLRTFQGWPKNLKQTPEMLAVAGFYYIGSSDQVRCFHCDGGLRNWEANDDAWTEHAKWFPRCGFVNLVRGPDFVKQCIDNRPPLDPAILNGVEEEESNEVTETPPTSLFAAQQSQIVTDTVLEGLLNTAPAMAALEVGLHVGRVKMALKRRMEQTGVPYADADQLIEDVLHQQFREDDSRNDAQTPDSPSAELTHLLNQIINTQSSSDNDAQPSEQQHSNGECSRSDKDDKEVQVSENAEKKEPLLDKNQTATLEEENRRLKEARLCKICMDQEVAVVFLSCGHLATCVFCAPSLTHCPLCRQEIRATVRTFLS